MATLGSQTVGSAVKLNVNGTAKEFIVVHQGKPSSLYDDSCNGTWLLMKDLYESRAWHSSSSNSYKASTIHSYLNSTFLNLFDADIKTQIKTVKIPYVNGTGNSAVASGANGLSAQIFLLSGYEVGFTTNIDSNFPVDGAKLSYFDVGTTTNANNKRIAYLSGSATLWWLRSPYTSSNSAWSVGKNGNYTYDYYNGSTGLQGIRPALVLPANLPVSSDGTITVDPMAPKDGHNTLLEDGTVYAIESGQELSTDGTVYEIESGNAMADDGTIYEIPFKSKTYTVTITGSGVDGFCYVSIGNRSYEDAATVEVEKGTEINCTVAMMASTHGYIYLNNMLVASTTSGTSPATYQYTVQENVGIELRITGTSTSQKRSIYIVDT